MDSSASTTDSEHTNDPMPREPLQVGQASLLASLSLREVSRLLGVLDVRAPVHVAPEFIRLWSLSEAGTQVPNGWETNGELEAAWPCLGGRPMTDAFNEGVSSIEDWSWLVTCVRSVSWAFLGQKIIEIVRIHWRRTWVPLHLIRTTPHQKKLRQLKSEFNKLNSRSAFQRNSIISEEDLYRLGKFRLVPRARFHVHQVLNYTILDGSSSVLECVLVDFKDTWEHASAIMSGRNLWEQVAERRLDQYKWLQTRKMIPSQLNSVALSDLLKNYLAFYHNE